MNNIIKSGEVMKLKDLISYEEGSIANLDVVSNDTMKFVLMAFDEVTGLPPHRAPENAIIFLSFAPMHCPTIVTDKLDTASPME